MEVKTGYQQTEVGVIPEDWKVTTAAQVCELVVDCKNRTPPVVDGGDYAVVRTPNVRNGRFVREELRFTDEKSFRVWTARAIPQVGDILITREAPLGEVCLVPPDLRVCLGQRMMLYRPDQENTASEFLLYELMSSGVQSNLLRKIGGSTVGHAKVNDIRNLQIPLPPTRAEQEAIGWALSDADALIEAQEELIVKKRQLKQGAMQELFSGKKRLPGFSTAWESKRLGDLGSTFGGLSGKSKTDFGNGHSRYITFMNIMTNVVIDCGAFERVSISATESQNRVSRGDLFFNGSSETPDEVGMCALLAKNVDDVYLNSFCFGFRLHEGASADGLYLAYYFRSGEGRELLKSLAQGAIRYNLSKTAFLKLTFHLPSLAEQTSIAAIFSDMDFEIAALERELAKARQLKQGMMQELLTGKVRLA